MIKQLKKIMFNIARLPTADQRWLLQRLSSTEMATLNKWRGLKLLDDAQRFRSLKPDDVRHPEQSEGSPDAREMSRKARHDVGLCQLLAMKAPLYAAIIIEQGSYPWALTFLNQFDENGAIQTLLNNQVLDLKPIVKQAVFNEWERLVSFESWLDDDPHG